MCGIAGIRRFGDEPIREDQIRILAASLMHRGIDATGVALMTGDTISVYKRDVPAWRLVKDEGYRTWLKEHLTKDTEIALIHDRAATKGDPQDNENNHPLFAGETCVIHNGVLRNDDHCFKSMKLKREAAVDSDILRAILDEHGLTKKGVEALGKVEGTAAIAAISTKYPGKLLLARSGNPLVVAMTGTEDEPGQMLWASEKASLHLAVRPFYKKHGIYCQPNRTDVCYVTMNNESAWLFGEETLEWTMEFRPHGHYSPPQYDAFGGWREHNKRWGKEGQPANVLVCPSDACRRVMSIPEDLKNEPLANLECTRCGTNMAEALHA